MSGIIVDGKGTSYKAQVDSRNELHTRARIIDQSALKCVDEQVYLLSIPFYTVTATASLLAWMNFTDTAHYLVIDKLIPSWNGGNANHNRAMKVEYLIGSTVPTAGHTPYALANSNTLSTDQLSATVYVWDGSTGTGMTQSSGGVPTGRMIVDKGYTIAPVDSKMIIAPNTTLGLRVTPEETGEVTFTGYFYLFNPTVDG